MRPLEALAERLDRLAREALPVASALFLVMVSVLPLRLAGAEQMQTALPLLAVFFWAVHRPDLLPAPLVFLVGLLQDFLTGVPAGLNTVVLLLLYGAVRHQRRFFAGRPFLVVWSGLMLVGLGALAIEWLLGSALLGTLVDPGPLAFRYAFMLAAYPVLNWILVRASTALPAQRDLGDAARY